ncbi:hypothetical protein [Nocardioides sp. Soil805]|uniref:hypothetical protein n=1 Tax=Nocardioides sp. Soil805 TaxID=1736416 RepID=UPI000702CEA1|nr:hypothetical protein [Nocardioides sp. Soil805]KRF35328.1 hypothetical protein ASG94_14605 [Nocardioides sp. Soil805]
MALRTALVCALLAVLAACTAPDGAGVRERGPGAPEASTSAPRPPDLQRTPLDWSRVPWVGGGRRTAPTADTDLPDVLQDPVRARLVHHPVEGVDDPVGWTGERLLFLGVDDRWRSLDMDDLGLPAGSWPGVDTYGSGSLSRDGRLWAAQALGGVVLLDLGRGTVRYVELPASRARVVRVDWVPGREVLSVYAARPASSRYDTFQIDTRGRVRPVRYPGWRTRFDVDGTPVEVAATGRHRLAFRRWTDGDVESTTVVLDARIPRAMRSTAFGTFGAVDVALLAHRGWPSSAPAQVWVLDKASGAMTARLQVPATTSIIDWVDDHTLRLLVANRRVVEWQTRTGEVRRVVELPGPYPDPGEWAAATLAFPSP